MSFGQTMLCLLSAATIFVSFTVLMMDWGTPKLQIEQTVLIRPSSERGLVVAVDCWRHDCRYLVRTQDPLAEQWFREPGLEVVP